MHSFALFNHKELSCTVNAVSTNVILCHFVSDIGVDDGAEDSEMDATSEESLDASELNRHDDSEIDEDLHAEQTSDEEEDRLSIDDNLDGEDWMDVDADESDSNKSISSDDESDNNTHIRTDLGDPKLHGNAGWADAMSKILR